MSDAYFSDYPGLRFERRDHGILLVTIDRPEALNATDARLHRGLSRVWDDIDDDDDTRVVIITGSGDAFSAGGDLEWIEGFRGNYGELREVMREAGDVVYRMLRCRKIIISAINGVAVGAGLAIGLMADISLVSQPSDSMASCSARPLITVASMPM